MNPSVSVVYVNYNSSGLLLRSFASLLNQCKAVSFEVIIIDNASRDEEKEQLQAGLQDFPRGDIHLIFSEENLGFGRANNLGANQAKGDYLFFLNPDTLIVNDVISIFYEFLKKANLNIVGCGGSLLKSDLSPNDSYGNFPGLLQELAMTGLGFRFFIKNYRQTVAIAASVPDNSHREVDYIVGADIFIRTESFRLVKGFDENYFLYYEETDLFKMLKAGGLKSFLLPEARIVHYEGAASGEVYSGDFSVRKFRFLLKSKLYYYQKWFPSYKITLLNGILFFQILIQYLKGNMGHELRPLLTTYSEYIKSGHHPKSRLK